MSYRDRWVYICYLTFETDGSLDNEPPEEWLALQCGLSVDEFQEARANLRAVRLLTAEGRVQNYLERQYENRKAAERQRRYRDTNSDVTRNVTRNATQNVPDTETESETEADLAIPYDEIIGYLNEATGRRFRPTTPTYRQYILARWRECHRLEDFKRVIDVKVGEWSGDAKTAKWLRPSTLFGPKFDEYRNQATPVAPANQEPEIWKDDLDI